jgi:hypothetical protein
MHLYVVPAPPSYTASNVGQGIYTAVMAVAILGFLLWWLLDDRERHRPHLPLILLGGLLSTLLEPAVDNMVLFGWPRNALWATLQANGHYYPAYVPMGYVWFDGGMIYLMYRLFERGLTARQIWGIAAAWICLDMPLNAVGHWFHFNGFFGPQPLEFWGYPLWWVGSDAVLMLLGGAVLWKLMPQLRGWAVLFLLLWPGINQGIAAGAVLWPISWALHADVPQYVRTLCGLATLGVAASLIWLVTKYAATPKVSADRPAERMEELAQAGVLASPAPHR